MDQILTRCSRCVMDITDPDIIFDDHGICNHCHAYDSNLKKTVFDGEEGRYRLNNIVEQIKADGVGKEYDCVIGISGGVDSSFVAYQTKQLGLRPLAVHLDNGWDSGLAVKNIENILQKLGIDLHTYVIDWDEFKDLQLSFLKASTPDSEIPTDHAIFATLMKMCEELKTRHLITGINLKTESHHVNSWSQGHMDWKYIRSVHKKFGTLPLRSFPYVTRRQYKILQRKLNMVHILNYLDYDKTEAMAVLEKELNWRYYGGKHHESIYTRFFQGYILPKKFGFDKRKMHLSSLICSGLISREQALEELSVEPYPIELQIEDRDYVIKKLGISDREFDNIMNLPLKTYWDYPSYAQIYRTPYYKAARSMYRFFKSLYK